MPEEGRDTQERGSVSKVVVRGLYAACTKYYNTIHADKRTFGCLSRWWLNGGIVRPEMVVQMRMALRIVGHAV